MKTKILFMFFILILNSMAQDGWGAGEIYIGTRGLTGNEIVRYKMEAFGSLWGGGPLWNPHQFVLNPTSPYPSYRNAIASREWSQFFSNTIFSTYNWPFFRMISQDGPLLINSFGYGLYKFYVEQYAAYFYIDYRDANYSFYNNCPGNQTCNDIWVKYERNIDKFFYIPYDMDFTNEGIDPDHPGWIQINNGEVLFYYNIKTQFSPNTIPFPNFWQNSLILVETEDNHPMLILGSYPIQNIYNSLEYFIYRKVGNNSSFVKIATLPSTTLSYIDESISISHILGGTPVYYYVTANIIIDGEGNESSPSNIVDCNGSGQGIEKKKQGKVTGGNIDFIFINNYPNPFNPVTRIKYSVIGNQKVTLKVSDVLGNEVATLVNGIKEAGNYEVEFTGDNLSSGVYFTKLATSNFTKTIKMGLVK